MGKNKRRKQDEALIELSERLRDLEKRLKKKSRHNHAGDYENRSSRARSRSRSSYEQSHTRSPTPRRRRSPSTSRRRRSPSTSRRCRSPSTPRRRRSPSIPRSRRSASTPDNECGRHSISPNGNTQTKRRGGADVAEAPQPLIDTPELIVVEEGIPAHIEGLLGQEGAIPPNNSIELHETLTKRWSAILQNGLEAETRASILLKYCPPKNCNLLVPPKLNEEVAAAMNESGLKRDKRIVSNQTILSAAITTLGKALNNLIAKEDNNNVSYIENLSDAARLLCDQFHENSITRRSLILPGLNKELKDLMENAPIGEYLFGDKLQEKVNAIKAVKKSGLELKNTPTQQKVPNKRINLNYRGPQRSQVLRPSGQKSRPKQPYFANKQATRGRRSPQKFQQSRRHGQERRGR